MVGVISDRTSKFSCLAKALIRSGYQDFYLGLARELATILGVEYIIIAKIDSANGAVHEAQTIAAIGHQQALDNFVYPLQGTPCETVPEREMCSYENAVTKLFPSDVLLADLAIESYVGMPILTSDGTKLGLIAAMSTRAWQVSSEDSEILQIAAAQVGAELELAHNRSHIQSLTYEDSVTGLPNAAHLNDLLAKRDDIAAVVLLDIRRFKDFNDLYGYREGDLLLNAVAARLRSRLNEHELVTRFSNDEFAIALSNSSSRSAADTAQALRSWFGEPLRCGVRDLNVDIRLGLSQRDDTYQSHGELLRQASIALAEAKRNDTPVVAYARNMVETLEYRQTIYDRLIVALRTDQLRLHYQPVFDLDSGELFGAEALCRWHDPQLGWIGPNIFIPVAEERGLMNELGLWVLRAAAKQLRSWREQGLPFHGKLSVNISNRQLEPDDVIETFMECLDEVTPSQLVLELTESSIMRAPEHNIRQINRLKELGFRWALDDFGTGYSSLAYLTRLNVDVIKIDRSFIAKIPGNTNDEMLVRTLVAMAKTMNMVLVGEGIEQPQQLAMLRELGCHLGQGYHLGRPVCAEEFADTWLKKR
ncbi:putative bifunctional diguanylate cyclase/phosphodiesterase [Pseudidiomarina mangrovi]|uniref:putative bifunctional diguanylate cyclase/phosphodiesterase n=1 Tax=Pseudidiomarina mangrovi TaxID=2487133 RepID=UPI000FCBCAF5|nr:sensor domain-containing phosphodiesterase [Pseudidiomarina mangrovi]